ncbi:MAG: hypothetical protein OCC45_15990 [Desulfotalea sp.]
MSSQQDDILIRELGKIGSLGGKICGGGVGATGGSLGASLAARFLPTEQYQQQVSISQDVATTLTKLASFLAIEGRVANDSEAGTSQYPKVSGILGSGFFKMNPTMVHVEVIVVEDDTCLLLVSGAAKEGLIKQRSAQKAVNRIVEFIGTIG